MSGVICKSLWKLFSLANVAFGWCVVWGCNYKRFNVSECHCILELLPLLFAVVYLDADTIVVKSIEDLFKCGKFCANLKHSERLNSGVMVVEPSEALFKDMMDKVAVLPSYTGGDIYKLSVNMIYFFFPISSPFFFFFLNCPHLA